MTVLLLRVKITKKRMLIVLLMTVCIGLSTLVFVKSGNPKKIKGADVGDRLAYIYSLGLSACEKSVKDITIPAQFSADYEKYNQLQRISGFDLADYRTKPAKLYTYTLKNSDKLLHLITVNEKIVGADITDKYGANTASVKNNGEFS